MKLKKHCEMKFKKVEIQAFRAYQEIENGTFNFEIENAKTKDAADFVSIYAPNGFGKTSFYDAVEYGVTNSIDRFLKNPLPKNAASSERTLSTKKGGQKILRNRFVVDENIESEVHLYTTNSVEPFIRKVPKNKRRNSSDFHFDKNQVENKSFQTVILSQEWIDAFLKVDDPNNRYEKFMNYFGDTESAEYYKKIVNLTSQNDKRIVNLKLSLNGVQKEIDFSGDKDILTKVNDKIIELKKDGETLSIIDESFTETESLDLTNSISERTSSISFEMVSKEETIQFIDDVFTGGGLIIGIETYYKSKNEKIELDKNAKQITVRLDQFKQNKELLTEKDKLIKKQQRLLNQDSLLKELLKSFAFYKIKVKEIEDNNTKLEEVDKENESLDKELVILKIKESEEQSRLKQINDEIKTTKERLESCRNLHLKIVSENEKFETNKQELKDYSESLGLLNVKINNIKFEIDNLDGVIKELDNKVIPSAYDKGFLEYKETIQELEDIKNRGKLQYRNLEILNEEIREHKKLAQDIEAFIAKGAELVDKAQSSTCPLCSKSYDSYNELSNNISNSKYLSQKLSDLLKSRSDKEVEINELEIELKGKIDSFRTILQNVLSESKKEYEKLKEKKAASLEVIEKLESKYKLFQKDIDELNSILNGLTFDLYEEKTNITISTQYSKTKILDESLKKAQEIITKSTTALSANKDKSEILRNSIKELMSDNSYKSIIDYFTKEMPKQVIKLDKLNDKQEEVSKEIDILISRNVEIHDTLKELESSLKDTTEELSSNELKSLMARIRTIEESTIAFERELFTRINIKPIELEKEALIIELESIKNNELKLIEVLKQKLKNYNLLKELKQNVEPFLKYQEAKKTEADIIARKKFLESKVRPLLKKEKKKVSDYLDQQIGSFFYEDLINDLYRRIDPHPDYKRLKFDCDFRDDKPKLNVFLYKDGEDNNPIIPNLYFSTAQLNILSLSIFLAKALNAKDEDGNSIDCIFIDDPIQSMDSINILSTIDLFRSIVVNQEKQIILSTHDENFHNLLRKKMPPSLFKSKFMELETFGKVKKEIEN